MKTDEQLLFYSKGKECETELKVPTLEQVGLFKAQTIFTSPGRINIVAVLKTVITIEF